MSYRLLADAVVVAHLLFILFVVFGGLLVLRWPRLALAHLPAACWGALIEIGGWICPLTPLENGLREAAGEAGYPGSFVGRYLLPVIYPAGLTRELQFVLAGVVVAVNLAVYAALLRRWGARRSSDGR